MKKDNNNKLLIIISGPTSSGKTDLSESIAELIPSEIVNADIGQFYSPFLIGTAKPDWKNKKIPHHLFDILDEPKNLSVTQYKELLSIKINEIWKRNKIPIVVGGSLFYLKSLFFPPKEIKRSSLQKINYDENGLWDILNKIDPVRASQMHRNDIYRIERALDIWKTTGVKPSELKPEFLPFFNSIFIYMDLDKKKLHERINRRTKIMFDMGWIDEVRKFIDTPWEKFFSKKGLIGYKEILNWIKAGENNNLKIKLIEDISIQTRQYAKRQRVFWKSFKKQLEESSAKSSFFCKIKEVKFVDYSDFNFLKNIFKNYFF